MFPISTKKAHDFPVKVRGLAKPVHATSHEPRVKMITARNHSTHRTAVNQPLFHICSAVTPAILSWFFWVDSQYVSSHSEEKNPNSLDILLRTLDNHTVGCSCLGSRFGREAKYSCCNSVFATSCCAPPVGQSSEMVLVGPFLLLDGQASPQPAISQLRSFAAYVASGEFAIV